MKTTVAAGRSGVGPIAAFRRRDKADISLRRWHFTTGETSAPKCALSPAVGTITTGVCTRRSSPIATEPTTSVASPPPNSRPERPRCSGADHHHVGGLGQLGQHLDRVTQLHRGVDRHRRETPPAASRPVRQRRGGALLEDGRPLRPRSPGCPSGSARSVTISTARSARVRPPRDGEPTALRCRSPLMTDDDPAARAGPRISRTTHTAARVRMASCPATDVAKWPAPAAVPWPPTTSRSTRSGDGEQHVGRVARLDLTRDGDRSRLGDLGDAIGDLRCARGRVDPGGRRGGRA